MLVNRGSGTEVGQKKQLRLPLADLLCTRDPLFQVDLGGRGHGEDAGPVRHPNTPHIAHEGHTGRLVEIRDVMRGMSGCVDDLELAAAKCDRFSAL